jgi:OmpA-OmpF porin, OOP family
MTRSIAPLALAVLTGIALPLAAAAQSAETMSEDEIMERFQNQKTRSLVLAPVGGQSSEAAGNETAAATVIESPDDDVFVNIAFDFDSAALREDQKPKLTKLCNVINEIDIETFEIIGHTDSSGSDEYNQRLSRLRAEEVKRYMVGDCGIDPGRLLAVGLGESEPLDPSNPRADENRRVEFQVSS